MNRAFTIDAGVRFYVLTPTRNRGGQVTQFVPEQFDPSAAPLLFQPVTTPQGRRARNPLTGEVLPAVYVGRLVPGSGNPGQCHAAVRGHAAREFTVRSRAASRFRLGCRRRWPDSASRRCRRVLRLLPGQRPPGARRDPAAGADLHHELHDDRGAPEQSAHRDAERGQAVRRLRPARRLQLEPRSAA